MRHKRAGHSQGITAGRRLAAHSGHGGAIHVHGGNDLSAVGFRQQRLKERVRIGQALLLNNGFISDDSIAPVQIAVILLTEALDEENGSCAYTHIWHLRS